MPPAPLAERLARYLARPGQDSFEELALAAFAEVYESDPVYRELCERHAASPDSVGDWRAIPTTPATGEDRESAAAAPAAWYRDAAERAFQIGCLTALDAPAILQMVPAADPGALDHELAAGFAQRFGGGTSAVDGARIDVVAARSWLAGRQRDHRAALLLASGASLRRLLTALERQDLRFQLAPGSRAVLMGGPDPLSPAGIDDLPVLISERLGLTRAALLVRYTWDGVPTALYGRLDGKGRLESSAVSPWLRVRALEPETGRELAAGASGRLAVLDLTIRGRPFHIATGSAGTVDGSTVRVLP